MVDYNLLKPKEILSKLHSISSEIIGLYEKIIKLVEEGKNLDEYLSLMTKLKILITKESIILKSLTKEKILSCRLAIKGEGIFIALMDSTIDYNLEDDDLFSFPKEETVEIRNRVSSRLFQTQQIEEGKVVSFKLFVDEKRSNSIQLGSLSSFTALINIKTINNLKKQLEKGYTNIDMPKSLKDFLKIKLNVQFIKLLMESYALEFLTFLFNSSPIIDDILDNSIEVIEKALDSNYDNNGVDIIGNLGQEVVDNLSKLDIDVSDSNIVMNSEFEEIYKYIWNITKLDVILSYSNMTALDRIKFIFEEGQNKEGLISFALKLGLVEQAESLNVNLKDDYYKKYLEFKSVSVEAIVGDMLHKCRQRLLSNGKN